MELTKSTTSQLDRDVLALGDTVYVGSGNERMGKVAFIGETQFAAGEWIGVVLRTPNGKNDGSVNGVKYFRCQPSYGIFAKRQNLRRVPVQEKDTLPTDSNFVDDQDRGVSPKSTTSPTPVLPSPGGTIPSRSESKRCLFQVGDRVQISGGRSGILRYLGPTEFAAGEWAGIELDEPLGKNDGSVGGNRYFTCKPNFGLFAAAHKLMAPGSQVATRNTAGAQHRRSQESLLSYCSNLSSVSRSYRAQYAPSVQNRTSTPASRRQSSAVNSSTQKEQLSNIQTLQRLIREKEEHISQLLEERDLERSDLAKATLEKEQAELTMMNQRHQIERLNEQLEKMQVAHRMLQDEREQLLTRLHDEKKRIEDLQFRMEEEKINKSTLESLNADDESKIFELEEALISAREINERTEAELSRLREELSAVLGQREAVLSGLKSTEAIPQQSTSSQTEPTATIGVENFMSQGAVENQDAMVGSQRKPSLRQENMVTESSIPPLEPNPEDLLQAEVDRLQRELNDREKVVEDALKRQAQVLELTTAEYEKQLSELKSQLADTSNQLSTTKDEHDGIKSRLELTTASLQKDIEELKNKLQEEEQKSNEKILSYQNQIADLTAAVEYERNRSSESTAEHQVAMHTLEEKLKVVERQLEDYQSSVLSSAVTCVQDQMEQISNLADSKVDSASMLSKLKEQEASIQAQLEQLETTRSERDAAIEAKLNSENQQKLLEASLESIRGELGDAQRRQEELLQALSTAHSVRDQLVSELSLLLNILPPANGSPVEDVTQTLKKRIEELSKHVVDAETNRNQLESRVHTLESERSELERELTLLKITSPTAGDETDVALINEQLEAAKSKMANLEADTEAALSRLEAKSSELQAVQKQLDETLNEYSQMKASHEQAVDMLESEKRQLLERIQLIEANSNTSAQCAAPISNDQMAQLLREKAGAESQVSFLNSIIVDLHKKNAELEERVRSMLMGYDAHPTKPSESVHRPPRPWCDNCLIFDSHETENCPHQHAFENGIQHPKKLVSRQKFEQRERLYCDICGVFDSHGTEECTNNETF